MAASGMKSFVSINFQDSGGASQVTSLDPLPMKSETVKLNFNSLKRSSLKRNFNNSETEKGASLVDGNITADGNPDTIGLMLRAYFGNYNHFPLNHIYKSDFRDFDERYANYPFTAEIDREVGSSFLYYDLQGTGIEIGLSQGELLQIDLSVVGAGFSRKEESTTVYSYSHPFRWDQVSAQIDNTNVIDFKEIKITGNKNIIPVYTLGNSNSPLKFKRDGFQEFEVSGKLIFQSQSYQQAFEEYSTHSFKLNLATESATLAIDMPSFKFTEFSEPIDGKSVLESDFKGIAEFNTGSQTAIDIQLTNTRSEFYGTNGYFILDHLTFGKLDQSYNELKGWAV